MKILLLENGFHGKEPMMNLLEQGQITNAQFLLYTEPGMRKVYEKYCSAIHANPYDEDVATQYITPWMEALKKKDSVSRASD